MVEKCFFSTLQRRKGLNSLMVKRVLIITYYWPPSGGSAVLRWLKFTKYLRDYGWEPVIYTPENPESQEVDVSLLTDIPDNLEILKTRIIEPYTVYKWLTGRKKADRLGVALMAEKKKPGIFGTFSLWIRSNLFIPDPRILWIKPSVSFLEKYLDKNPVDIIVSTGPPHSMHLIAKRLKEKKGIKWLADFRDPWTNIDFYRELTLTNRSDRKHKKLEMEVLRSADHIVTVSPGMTAEFKKMGVADVTTITNGYDKEIFNHSNLLTEGFNIVHLGSMPKSRNPRILWEALNELLHTEPGLKSHLKVHLIGKTDIAIFDSIQSLHLENFVKQHAYIPHSETQGILSSASVLLLCINNSQNAGGILTNKFFEYLSAQRPVLAIGPINGDAATILNESGAGKIFEYTDVTGLKNHLIALFKLYTKDALEVNSKNIARFSRKSLTDELSDLLNRIAH